MLYLLKCVLCDGIVAKFKGKDGDVLNENPKLVNNLKMRCKKCVPPHGACDIKGYLKKAELTIEDGHGKE